MHLVKRAAFILVFIPMVLVQNHVNVVTFQQLQSQAALKQNDTLYVVNFWATWCDPCVKELPNFQQAYKKYKQFANDKTLEPEVLLMNGGNPNNWIDKVDTSWSGAIPATVMYKHGKKVYFHEGELTQDNLNKTIETKNK